MQNIKLRKQEFLSVGHSELDSKLGGGLRPGRITELVGPAELTHAIASSCLSASIKENRSVAIIDYVHGLRMNMQAFTGVPVVQPERLRDLARIVGTIALPGMELIALFLGDEISFYAGRPRSNLESEADLCLQQIRWSLANANTACLVVTDYPVMPDGPTVLRVGHDRTKSPERFVVEITQSLEQEFRFIT